MHKDIFDLIVELTKRDCNNATIQLCILTDSNFIKHDGITIVKACSSDLTFIISYISKSKNLFMNLGANGISITAIGKYS